MFLVKIVRKITGNQKTGNKQSKNSREKRERKDKTKGKQSKSENRSNKFVNGKRKGFLQCFKSRDEILKLKIKIKIIFNNRIFLER